MKPQTIFFALLFLAACTATEQPIEDVPEKENYYPDSPNQNQPVPAPDSIPMKDTFASATDKKQGEKKKEIIRFTPPEVVREEVPEEVPPMIWEERLVGTENVQGDIGGDELLEFDQVEAPDDDMPLIYAEEMPAYKSDLKKYIDENLKYPEATLDAGVEGKVFIRFVVTEEGIVKDAEVLRGIYFQEEMNKEALRVIKSIPDGSWTPGKQNGRIVDVYMTVPVPFVLPRNKR